MTAPFLGVEEIWLLRCIHKHCRVPDSACAFVVYRVLPSTPVLHPGSKEIHDQMDFDLFRILARSLRNHGFIDADFTAHDAHVSITIDGKAHLYELDHPDLVETYRQRVRQHPVLARVIFWNTIVGAAIAWVALLLGIIATVLSILS
jgi:hypothetical protein